MLVTLFLLEQNVYVKRGKKMFKLPGQNMHL